MKRKLIHILQDDKLNCLWAFVLTVGTMFLAMSYAQVVPWGKYCALAEDLYVQYATFGSLLAQKIKEGSSLLYSFHVGLGTNTALLWAFYCFSPADLIYFLFNDIAIATQLVLLLKAGLMGAFFQLFCRYNLGNNEKYTIVFSVCYGLCAYQLVVCKMSSLTDGLYFLPLILILVKRLVRTKKMALLSLVYAGLFLTNFYCGYIVGLASLGYLFLVLFLEDKGIRTFREKIKICFLLVLSAVIGFFLVAGILLPAAAYVLRMESGGVETFSVPGTVWQEYILSLFALKKYELYSYTPYLYCGILGVLLCPFYFVSSGVKKKEKICVFSILGILFLGFGWEPLCNFLHMFNEPNGYTGRFAYLIVFIILVVALKAFSGIDAIEKRHIVLVGIVVAALLIICVCTESVVYARQNLTPDFSLGKLLYNCALIFGWVLIITCVWKNKREGACLVLILCVVMEMGINAFGFYYNTNFFETETYAHTRTQTRRLLETIEAGDSGWYRINVKNERNKNNSAEYQYYGIPFFSSAYSEALVRTMSLLGYQSTELNCSDVGRTETTDMLFGVKYAAYPESEDGEQTSYIEESPYALSIGYMVSSSVLSACLDGENAFDNQEILLSAMIDRNVDLYDNYDENVTISGENVLITTRETEEGPVLSITKNDNNEPVTAGIFEIPYEENRGAYAIISGGGNILDAHTQYIRTAYSNELTLANNSTLSAPHIVKMEKSEDGNSYVVYLAYYEASAPEALIYDMHFAYYNAEVLEECYNVLAVNQLQVELFEDGHVKGNVIATQEMPILFLSVPMEDGWKLYVDGKEQEIIPLVEGAFIGARLSPGEHEIELVFEAPGSRAGMYCSLAGAVLWCVILGTEIMETKKRKRGSH